MVASARTLELQAPNGDVRLAGALWLPREEPAAVVLMHPGSGPSDRDNDVYFPPIRAYLLEAGIGVASFDKRGVGGSSGRWEDAAVEEQAEDALGCLAAVRARVPAGVPIGLFGHSQGGWVVVEAAARDVRAAFVVVNSGPGVTPAEQERYATRAYMRRAGIPEGERAEVERFFDRLLVLARARVPLDEIHRTLAAEGFPSAYERLGLPLLPDEPAVWELLSRLVDYDPRPALERIRVPVLALFGGGDEIVPVEESVRVYREAVAPELLTVRVFPGADHRVQTGDPPAFVEGYLEALAGFVPARRDSARADGR